MKKITLALVSLILFLSLFFFLNLSTSHHCKTVKIFKHIIDFGTKQLSSCISIFHLRTNLKEKTKNYPVVYDILRSIKRTYINPDYRLDHLSINSNQINKNSIKQINKKKIENINNEIPFIKGIIDQEFSEFDSNKPNNDSYEEYNSWFRSHGGNWNSNYDSENKINKKNISKLNLLWKFSTIKKSDKNLNNKWKLNIQVSPIFINGKLIFVSADWKIIAIDVLTGKAIWELQSIFLPCRRGMLSTHDDKLDLDVLYINIGSRVFKINVNTGKKIKTFGENGSVKANTLVAPMIYKNNLVIMSKRNVLIFDSDNGKLINSIPIYDSRNFSGGIVWGGVALDSSKGIVFANTANPQPSSYGVNRPGDNKRSSSVVAVDLNKNRVLWDFQDTAHDLWDYDIPSPPILHELKINDKIYEVVISVTKTGNTLIFERNTGKPIFDINYKKAPQSNVFGEITSGFQIDLKKPENFAKIEFTLNDINKLSASKQKEIMEKLKNAKYGWYEPPSLNNDLIMFGLHGGAEWMGGAIDPIKQHLFIPTQHYPWKYRPYMISIELITAFPNEIKDFKKLYSNKCGKCHGKIRNGLNIFEVDKQFKYIPSLVGLYLFPSLENKVSIENINNKHEEFKFSSEEILKIQKLFKWWDKKLTNKDQIIVLSNTESWTKFLTNDGLPASNPPWGYITKLDLVSGKILWKKPVGYLEIDGKKINVGTQNFGGLTLNAGGILFFTGTEDSLAYAIDADTGKELWSYEMDAAGSSPPIIFNYKGKQYVSFLSTGGGYYNYKKKSSSIYTFGIVE